MNNWQKPQDWEAHWHSRIITNTYHEETKQFEYAKRMGIETYGTAYTPLNFKNYGKILDIGGGETSMLLKVENPTDCVIVDPCDYPSWITDRYKSKEIELIKQKGEDIKLTGFDEVWIYNCLQHTEDPEKIVNNARQAGKLIRIFEWIDTPTNEGHIQKLTHKNLDKWLGGTGKIEDMKSKGCFGKAYYGIFLGNQYAKV